MSWSPESTDAASSSKKFKGVRKRKWGSWVSEIRLPKSRKRIWLGSYDAPDKAARAFDAAFVCLRGRGAAGADLNFPDSPPPCRAEGCSSDPWEVQAAAVSHANRTAVKAQQAASALIMDDAGGFSVPPWDYNYSVAHDAGVGVLGGVATTSTAEVVAPLRADGSIDWRPVIAHSPPLFSPTGGSNAYEFLQVPSAVADVAYDASGGVLGGVATTSAAEVVAPVHADGSIDWQPVMAHSPPLLSPTGCGSNAYDFLQLPSPVAAVAHDAGDGVLGGVVTTSVPEVVAPVRADGSIDWGPVVAHSPPLLSPTGWGSNAYDFVEVSSPVAAVAHNAGGSVLGGVATTRAAEVVAPVHANGSIDWRPVMPHSAPLLSPTGWGSNAYGFGQVPSPVTAVAHDAGGGVLGGVATTSAAEVVAPVRADGSIDWRPTMHSPPLLSPTGWGSNAYGFLQVPSPVAAVAHEDMDDGIGSASLWSFDSRDSYFTY